MNIIIRFITWEYSWTLPAAMMLALIWLAIQVTRERIRKANKPRPTYYVQHPDGSFSKANPQPRLLP